MRAYDELPERWKLALAQHLSAQGHSRCTLQCSDFPMDYLLELRFEDGSKACFHHAFALELEEHDEIAVFSEHCGYHIFPHMGSECKKVALG